jgi:hypothetical protein
MSILSRSPINPPLVTGAVAPAPTTEQAAEPSLYLTDGVSLYRFIGAAAGGFGEMVELEDCSSLAVTVVPIGDLRARRMRVVTPAADE